MRHGCIPRKDYMRNEFFLRACRGHKLIDQMIDGSHDSLVEPFHPFFFSGVHDPAYNVLTITYLCIVVCVFGYHCGTVMCDLNQPSAYGGRAYVDSNAIADVMRGVTGLYVH